MTDQIKTDMHSFSDTWVYNNAIKERKKTCSFDDTQSLTEQKWCDENDHQCGKFSFHLWEFEPKGTSGTKTF